MFFGPFVPYPNITGVDSISDPDYIQFNTGSNASFLQGRVGWDTVDGALQLGLDGEVGVHLGEEIVTFCINKDTVPITKGQVVYLSGAQGDKPAVKLAFNASDDTSSKTFGIAMQDIGVNEIGYIMNKGQVHGLSLGSPFVTGDIVWLDSVAGGYTRVKPQAPNHLVFVGVVLRANPGNGIIYVQPQNGYEIDELHDVRITDIANDQVLTYESSTSLWKNKAVPVAPAVGAHLHMPDAGIDIFSRSLAGSTVTLTSGRVQLMFFTPLKTATIDRILMAVSGTASSGLTLARMGLYTWDGTTATLVAQTANNTSLFNSTFSTHEALLDTGGGFPATYQLVAGQRYALAVICVGTTPPSLVAGFTATTVGALTPRVNARKNAQSDLPATITSFDAGGTENIFGRLS